MIRVAIIDDQLIIAEGLKRILDGYDDIEVIALGKDGQEAFNIIENNMIDVILMDIRMPNVNGVEGVKKIRKTNKEVKILMLTTFDDEEYIVEAMASKANGYLFKDIHYDKLVEAIRNIYNGQYIIEAKVAQVLAENINVDRGEKFYKELGFTDREREIIPMIKEGFNNKQIALALFISEGTVKNYISSIYTKTNVKNRIELVNYLNKLMNV